MATRLQGRGPDTRRVTPHVKVWGSQTAAKFLWWVAMMGVTLEFDFRVIGRFETDSVAERPKTINANDNDSFADIRLAA